MSNSYKALYYAAAAATTIVGMLHLMLGPNNLGFNVNSGILFIVGGIAQVFWIMPMVRRWGTAWYAIGISGTAVLMALWVITRMPDNPINGRAGPADNPVAVTIEVLQALFIGLAAAILVYESRKKKQPAEKGASLKPARNGKHVAILAGIAAALVLTGAFLLPMAMPRPSGPPQGQGGPPGAQNQTSAQTGALADNPLGLLPVLYGTTIA